MALRRSEPFSGPFATYQNKLPTTRRTATQKAPKFPKKVLYKHCKLLYNVHKQRETIRMEPKMKAKELIKQIRQAEKDTDNFYAYHFRDLVWDLMDGMEEGYIEGIESVTHPKPNKVRVECEDGIVWIHKTEGGLEYHDLNDEIARVCRPTRRTASPYERTRAMVYATGNKWQIENFEATHR